MSEFFIVGKPRGGKTFLGVQFIYKHLCNPKESRPIVTNIGLNLAEIAAAMKADLKLDYLPDLSDRVRILDDEETLQFWCYSVGREFVKRRKLRMGRYQVEVPDFEDRGATGCVYVIDEIHIYYPATFGAQRDEDDLRFFLTQHGKMNIDCVFITQHPEQTSKVARRLAQEYMNVRNLSREPFMGFRVGNLFRYVRSLNSPHSGNPAPFESGFVSMDFAKFGKMYDTTKGVGIAGSLVKDNPKRGRSLWWLLVPGAVVVCVIVWLLFFAPGQSMRLAKRMGDFGGSLIHKDTNGVVRLPFLGGVGTNKSPALVVGSAARDEVVTNAVRCVGVAASRTFAYVFLSDGRVMDSRNGEVDFINRWRVGCLGVLYEKETPEESKARRGALPEPLPAAVFTYPTSVPVIPAPSQLIIIGRPQKGLDNRQTFRQSPLVSRNPGVEY